MRNDPNREYEGWRGFITKKLFYRADFVVCQTKEALDWLPLSMQDKACVIMNQVSQVFMEKSQVSEDYYLATGRLKAQKNYPILINAFHKLLGKYPEEKLYIYGIGELKEPLQKQIKDLGRTDSIIIKGITNDIPNILSHAKCFVLSSDYEGMPNGLLEALAVGIPSISTDCPCGGPRAIIDNMKNGILFPVKDVDSLYEALIYIQEHPEERHIMGKKAKEKAVEFSPDEVYKKWKKCINNV